MHIVHDWQSWKELKKWHANHDSQKKEIVMSKFAYYVSFDLISYQISIWLTGDAFKYKFKKYKYKG